jgi:hypothetical protein
VHSAVECEHDPHKIREGPHGASPHELNVRHVYRWTQAAVQILAALLASRKVTSLCYHAGRWVNLRSIIQAHSSHRLRDEISPGTALEDAYATES